MQVIEKEREMEKFVEEKGGRDEEIDLKEENVPGWAIWRKAAETIKMTHEVNPATSVNRVNTGL